MLSKDARMKKNFTHFCRGLIIAEFNGTSSFDRHSQFKHSEMTCAVSFCLML